MFYNEKLFEVALHILANEANTTVEAVRNCYEFDLYNTMNRVREIYEGLYNEIKTQYDEKQN